VSYTAPIKDMLFNMQHLAALNEIAKIPGFEDAGMETAQAVLEECARFNQDVLARRMRSLQPRRVGAAELGG